MEEPNHVIEKMEKGERFGRAEQKEEKREGRNLYSGLTCSYHNGDGDEDCDGTSNNCNSREWRRRRRASI